MKVCMRAGLMSIVARIIALAFMSGAAAAQPRDAPEPQKREAPAETKQALAPVYKPPLRGAPGGRVGGGTRGTRERDIFVLSVLAPDHTGLTTREQPSLFWFISAPTSLPVELTLVDPNAVEPVLETRLSSPVERGIHRIRLADHGVRLKPGVAYQWSVTVVPDAARRSRDILASGTVERVEPDNELKLKLRAARIEELAAVYAQAGIWYEALEAISDRIEDAPADGTLRRHRAELLAQAGLPEIAE